MIWNQLLVRKQTDNFQEAFAKHEESFKANLGKVQKWRNALREAADISGWELKDRKKLEFIEDIVKDISSKLIPTNFETHKELVGINSRLEELMLLLDTRSAGVRMIGICGMGGLGKTTIARVVYDLISNEFEESCFLADVREISEKSGLISLQKQLLYEFLKLTDSNIWNVYDGINLIRSRLRQKKVFLIIDDLVDIRQLECLAGKADWFGSGSRVIITSRDKHLLITHGVDYVYKPKELNNEEALQLFCKKAFKTHQPWKEYDHLSKLVVKYAGGLPLALKVIGSFLFGRTVEEWKSSLQRLKRDSANEILQILQISFDGLEDTEKKIFLDIACFFKGYDRDYVTKILEACDFNPVIGIHVLIEKSIISTCDNKLWMHDLVQEMGRQIVKRQCLDEPGKRSRLWNKEDVHHLLTKETGTAIIEGIMLNPSENMAHSSIDTKSFLKITNLRLLRVHNLDLPKGLECLSNKLCLLDWHGYSLESLPSNLQLDKIVELSMCYSNIRKLPNIIKPLENLKIMRFNNSKNLIRTPDFRRIPNLEKLTLKGCSRLREIHSSLFLHKKLMVLNLKDCTSLKSLPSQIAMESLTKLVLSGCSNLRKFPKNERTMECLSKLHLDGTAIEELPLLIELLPKLALLDLNDCKNLVRLPSTINGLKCLKTLKLSGCSNLENVPGNLGEIESLEVLDLSGAAIKKPESSIFSLRNLGTLSFRGCKGQSASTSWFSQFTLNFMPAVTSWFSHFPINLIPKRSSNPMGLVLPSLSGLSSSTKLDLSDCNLGEGAIPIDICNLSSLWDLNLSRNNFVSLPGNINRLSKLKYLLLEDCKRLQSLLDLPSNVKNLRVDGCASLERVPYALKSHNSDYLRIHSLNCFNLHNNNNLAFPMLKGFVEAESNPTITFSTVVPGSKIPKWFKYQNEGSTITITRSRDSYNKKNNKLEGYAICSIFHVHKHSPTLERSLSCRTHQLNCYMKADQIKSSTSCYIDFDDKLGHPMSDHLWLLYLSNQELKKFNWKFESNHIELSFQPDLDSNQGLEVQRCGVHPLYVDKVEEFNYTTKEWKTYKVWKVNESGDQVSLGSKMDVSTTSKRSLTEYAEAAVKATDEGPQPKRFKQVE